MVKLLYSALYTQPAAGGEPVVLTSASELSSFGYFQRSRCALACAARAARGGWRLIDGARGARVLVRLAPACGGAACWR